MKKTMRLLTMLCAVAMTAAFSACGSSNDDNGSNSNLLTKDQVIEILNSKSIWYADVLYLYAIHFNIQSPDAEEGINAIYYSNDPMEDKQTIYAAEVLIEPCEDCEPGDYSHCKIYLVQETEGEVYLGEFSISKDGTVKYLIRNEWYTMRTDMTMAEVEERLLPPTLKFLTREQAAAAFTSGMGQYDLSPKSDSPYSDIFLWVKSEDYMGGGLRMDFHTEEGTETREYKSWYIKEQSADSDYSSGTLCAVLVTDDGKEKVDEFPYVDLIARGEHAFQMNIDGIYYDAISLLD